jgi:hypothetical protein
MFPYGLVLADALREGEYRLADIDFAVNGIGGFVNYAHKVPRLPP